MEGYKDIDKNIKYKDKYIYYHFHMKLEWIDTVIFEVGLFSDARKFIRVLRSMGFKNNHNLRAKPGIIIGLVDKEDNSGDNPYRNKPIVVYHLFVDSGMVKTEIWFPEYDNVEYGLPFLTRKMKQKGLSLNDIEKIYKLPFKFEEL